MVKVVAVRYDGVLYPLWQPADAMELERVSQRMKSRSKNAQPDGCVFVGGGEGTGSEAERNIPSGVTSALTGSFQGYDMSAEKNRKRARLLAGDGSRQKCL